MTITSHSKPELPAERTAPVPRRPPSERYGANIPVSPWSRGIDVFLGLILLFADGEEFVDFFTSLEVLHLFVAVGLGGALLGFILRVGTRDL